MDERLARSSRVLASVAQLAVLAPARNWLRHPLEIAPAVASTTLLLLFAGAVGLAAESARAVVREQAHDAAFVRFYLIDGADPGAVDRLEQRLRADPRVERVAFTSQADALVRARGQADLAQIAQDVGSNPFPASVDVRLRSIDGVGAVAAAYGSDPVVDPTAGTSYDPGAYGRLLRLLYAGGVIATVVLALLAVAAAALVASAIRASTVARADEIRVMRLVGASRPLVGSSFLTEGVLTGMAAGTVAAALLAALMLAGSTVFGSGRSLTALLPGIEVRDVATVLAALPLVGMAIAAAAGLTALRGLAK